MKWVVGLDLRPQTTGAIQFATWLCEQTGVCFSDGLQGVHVIEPEVLIELARFADEELIEGSVLAQAKKVQSEAKTSAHLPEPLVICGVEATNSLESVAIEQGADALIVGRRAAPGSLTFPRLGKVARKLLRRLELPVIVTPPTLLGSELGEGPIVVGVDLADDCVEALRFAQKMAMRLKRNLEVAYFSPLPETMIYGEFMPPSQWQQRSEELIEEGREELENWMETQRLTGVDIHVGQGPVIPGLARHASERDSPLLVCGSRMMSLSRRIVMPSVASELAAGASIPVAVVPPKKQPDS